MVTVLVVVGLLAGVGVVVLVLVAGSYNRLVRGRNAVDNAWAQTDVQLTRRHELVPNLVQTVQGYARHERATFEAVTAARAAAIGATGTGGRAAAEAQLSGALAGLFAVVEAYPQLRSSRNFADLAAELSDTENRIAYSRQYYNDAVLTYNNAVHTLPTNLVAAATGQREREFLTAPAEGRGPVRVRFPA